MTKFTYRRAEKGYSGEYVLESYFDDAEDVAVEAAEDYHSNHDGWESSWPIDFEIIDADGISLGTFEIDREAVPHFFLNRKRTP